MALAVAAWALPRAGRHHHFGTTDVAATTTAMRRAVIGHNLVSFVYSSVIVALLVSLIVR